MKRQARRCWWCTIAIPRRKRLSPDRRARCPRRSTNSTSFSPAWDQLPRQNEAINQSSKAQAESEKNEASAQQLCQSALHVNVGGIQEWDPEILGLAEKQRQLSAAEDQPVDGMLLFQPFGDGEEATASLVLEDAVHQLGHVGAVNLFAFILRGRD